MLQNKSEKKSPFLFYLLQMNLIQLNTISIEFLTEHFINWFFFVCKFLYCLMLDKKKKNLCKVCQLFRWKQIILFSIQFSISQLKVSASLIFCVALCFNFIQYYSIALNGIKPQNIFANIENNFHAIISNWLLYNIPLLVGGKACLRKWKC